MRNLKYIIRELKEEDLIPDKGFLKTLSNFGRTVSLPRGKVKIIFKELEKENSYIFVAVAEDEQIVGTVKLIIDQKFFRQGAKAGHIEDVVVRKEFETMGIASSLIKKAINKAQELKCYKVVLDCRDELITFYKKFGFNEFENCLRINF